MVGGKAHFEKIKFTGPDDPRIAHLKNAYPHGLPSYDEHWMVRLCLELSGPGTDAVPALMSQHQAATRSTKQHHAAPRSTTQHHAAPRRHPLPSPLHTSQTHSSRRHTPQHLHPPLPQVPAGWLRHTAPTRTGAHMRSAPVSFRCGRRLSTTRREACQRRQLSAAPTAESTASPSMAMPPGSRRSSIRRPRSRLRRCRRV